MPETPQFDSSKDQDTSRTMREVIDMKNGKVKFPDVRNGRDIVGAPPAAERETGTRAILSKLGMEYAFSKILSPSEKGTLWIKIERGQSFLSDPPIHTGS